MNRRALSPEFSLAFLDDLYAYYNRREFIHPDPLEFLYHYDRLADREVVALVASSLAYGRVAQILRSVSTVLTCMGPSPAAFLALSTRKSLQETFRAFKHRFTTGEHLSALLTGAKRLIDDYGSLQSCFLSGLEGADPTVVPALNAFVRKLSAGMGTACGMFLPSPCAGSACKRLNLFLRWMVRRDDVDPGGWSGVSPALLVVPLDTHMHRLALTMGLTQRKQADLRSALQITEAFRSIVPEDPVRYDFALTRLGIRKDPEWGGCLG